MSDDISTVPTWAASPHGSHAVRTEQAWTRPPCPQHQGQGKLWCTGPCARPEPQSDTGAARPIRQASGTCAWHWVHSCWPAAAVTTGGAGAFGGLAATGLATRLTRGSQASAPSSLAGGTFLRATRPAAMPADSRLVRPGIQAAGVDPAQRQRMHAQVWGQGSTPHGWHMLPISTCSQGWLRACCSMRTSGAAARAALPCARPGA